MHYALVLAATLPAHSLISRNTRTAEELLAELLSANPAVTAREILVSTSKLINLARKIGASNREIQYLTKRKNYIALNCLGTALRSVAIREKPEDDTGVGIGVGMAYLEARIRMITLCEIYSPELVKELQGAIMAQ